jgi:hypothetical protein
MEKQPMIDRRTVTGAALGLGVIPTQALASTGGVIEGQDTWSESAMVLYFDAELRNGLSLRISRYPDCDATWVWLHLLADGELYTFTERAIPCSNVRTTPEQPSARYDAPGLNVSIARVGTSRDMRAMSFSADLRAHRGHSGTDGPGESLVSVAGVFHPGPLRAGSPAGRFERTGVLEATVTAGGKTLRMSGVGKAHEQTQTRPRFTTPFTYAMLWNSDASLIGMMSRPGSYGDFDAGGTDAGIDRFKIEAWAPTRRFIAVMKDGSEVNGSAETLHSYEVPIFGRRWFGRVVRAEVGERRLVGMINDWKPDEQPYGLG